MASFGQLLRQLRLIAGLTQEELAAAAGISPRSVSDLERGINITARKDTARLLADALGLSGRDRENFEAQARGRAPAAGVAAATRTLPRDIASFTGRSEELRLLLAAAGDGRDEGVPSIYAIGGMAGVGKTTLAVHAAHLLAPSFPDGQIFLPLHAHTPGQPPVQPADALASMLQTAGIAAQQIPASLEARIGLWRDRLADQRVLLLLDDAASSEQVQPLLPASPGCVVLVTSRRHLTALLDARYISVDSLPAGQAAGLVAALAGRPDISARDAAVIEIAELCGCLPLALGMLARHLHHHQTWSAADLAADLAAARDRLELMHAEDLSVAAAFDLSYQDLTGEQQRLFRRLGLHPGTDIDAYAAAALDDSSLGQTRRNLDGLFDRYLLTEPVRGRYRLHDLIREHARVLAAADPPAERNAAAARLLDYYLHGVLAASRRLGRGTTADARLAGAEAMLEHAPEHAPELAGRDEAAAWLEAERLNLHGVVRFAAAHGKPGHAAAISAAMHEFFRSHGHWGQALGLHRAALEAARQADLRPAEAQVLTDLGDIQYLTDDYSAAAASLTQALELYRVLADQEGEAGALGGLGGVLLAIGDSTAALDRLTEALALYRSLGDRGGEAGTLTELGSVLYRTGDYRAAATSQQRALALYQELGDRQGEANALTDLGTVQCLTGDHAAAAASQERALALYRELGDRLGEANALSDLGTVQCLTGALAAAGTCLTGALALYLDLGDKSGEAEALNNMGDLALAAGRRTDALAHHERARDIAASISAPREEARAMEGIGTCHLLDGQPGLGAGLLRQALALYQQIGAPQAQRVADQLGADH
ncbi:MAG TPA: tetratricopeptide repeat protein [Streptosporangiaceae bacterium]